jgi:3',5'-nucleoside bisphosphate phosphatase
MSLLTNKSDSKLIDLHIHSYYSDGAESPNDIIKLAKDNKIAIVSITDHDTLLGNYNINFDDKDITIITGIELSSKVKTGRMHILGYDIDIHNNALTNKMNELKINSLNSVLAIISQINKDYGIVFPNEEINNLINAIGNIGRPNVAKLCVKYGYASYSQEAFNKYLIPAYEKTKKITKGITPEECIHLIKQAKGIPVLAHPNSLEKNKKELLLLVNELISYGLEGIEVFHSNHSKEESELFMMIATNYGLLYSGGTDYHGSFVKPDIHIGTGRNNNVNIKELSLIKRIRKI